MKKALSLALAGTLALSLLSGCTNQPTPSASAAPSAPPAPAPTQEAAAPYTYADTVAWDGQYDVIVVGFGGAGAVAAKTAADEGAKVLLVEKAPEGHEGGNTRYCGQVVLFGNHNYDDTLAYMKALAGQHDVPEAMLEVYAQSVSTMDDVLANAFGLDKNDFVSGKVNPHLKGMSPEYPEFPGNESVEVMTAHDGTSDGYLWKIMRQSVADRADNIDVWFESPATHLVQDPQSKTILGVTVERGGETLNIRADNGVVLSCGGFENNREMLESYTGLTRSGPMGTLYNTGDGVRMGIEVGADLWHMEAYEGIGPYGGSGAAVPEGQRTAMLVGPSWTSGSVIFVSGDGNRYLREDEASRHGHIYQGGAWVNKRAPLRSFAILTQEQYETAVGFYPLPDGATVQSAASIAELAALIGVDADTLVKTVDTYNGYAKDGYDPQFDRSAESMKPLTGDSFYAVETAPNLLNTQGGPRRNENAEVLDTAGSPIPHLYSAGELGGITTFQYNGGGNIAECITFGQIAGKNAAAAKNDVLPEYTAVKPVASNIQYTPGVLTDVTAAYDASGFADNEHLGMSKNGMGGLLYVKVTMDGDQISNVEVVQHKETEGIGTKAIDAIPGAIVEAGSTEVDTVASATITSKAIIEAVNDALSQVK